MSESGETWLNALLLGNGVSANCGITTAALIKILGGSEMPLQGHVLFRDEDTIRFLKMQQVEEIIIRIPLTAQKAGDPQG